MNPDRPFEPAENAASPEPDREVEMRLDRATGDGEPPGPDFEDDAEWAAAALAVALVDREAAHTAVSPALRRRLTADARAFFRFRPAAPRRRAWLPWGLAAASVIVAAVGWWPRLAPPVPASAGAVERLALTSPVAGEQAVGELTWDAKAQRGTMRFVGLAPNDPAREQYQLWIFDRERDERFPVDGGVFDIPAGADAAGVNVEFAARLAVGRAYLFAVTAERPGGVVVSDRTRIVAVATL
jgi:Anti-sigma-K factor rskA